MAFATKCLGWRPAHSSEETKLAYRNNNESKDSASASLSRDATSGPIKIGYHPVSSEVTIDDV